jgi:hypothetical protein
MLDISLHLEGRPEFQDVEQRFSDIPLDTKRVW